VSGMTSPEVLPIGPGKGAALGLTCAGSAGSIHQREHERVAQAVSSQRTWPVGLLASGPGCDRKAIEPVSKEDAEVQNTC